MKKEAVSKVKTQQIFRHSLGKGNLKVNKLEIPAFARMTFKGTFEAASLLCRAYKTWNFVIVFTEYLTIWWI